MSDKQSQWTDSDPIEINILWLKSNLFDQTTKIEVDTVVSMGLWNTCIGFIGKVSRPLIVDHPTSFKDRFNWWRVFRLQRVVIGMATKQLNWMENLQGLFCISTFIDSFIDLDLKSCLWYSNIKWDICSIYTTLPNPFHHQNSELPELSQCQRSGGQAGDNKIKQS